jgi:hypothetical protein
MTVISIPTLASALSSPERDDEYQEVVKEEELDGHHECPLWRQWARLRLRLRGLRSHRVWQVAARDQ